MAGRRFATGTILFRDPARIHAHSFLDGTLPSSGQSRYPVVVLRGGLGALTTQYTTLAEDLASHGYVVVGFDAVRRMCEAWEEKREALPYGTDGLVVKVDSLVDQARLGATAKSSAFARAVEPSRPQHTTFMPNARPTRATAAPMCPNA